MSASEKPPRWGYVLYEEPDNAPAYTFLEGLPSNVRQRLFDTLDAVLLTKHPPRAYLPNRWHSMKDSPRVDMGDYFEARDQHGNTNYRLFCRFDSAAAATLGAPVLVVLSGAEKPVRTALADSEYRAVQAFWDRYHQPTRRCTAVFYPPAKLPPSPKPGP